MLSDSMVHTMGVFGKKDRQLRAAFSKIKEELTQHLESINENTNEIQTNYEHLYEVDRKIDKLSERVDELYRILERVLGGQEAQANAKSEDYSNIGQLDAEEQHVFISLYNLDDKGYTTYSELAQETGHSLDVLQTYISSLISKGLPIIKRYRHDQTQLCLETEFKEQQAKHNILNIEPHVTRKVRGHAF